MVALPLNVPYSRQTVDWSKQFSDVCTGKLYTIALLPIWVISSFQNVEIAF